MNGQRRWICAAVIAAATVAGASAGCRQQNRAGQTALEDSVRFEADLAPSHTTNPHPSENNPSDDAREITIYLSDPDGIQEDCASVRAEFYTPETSTSTDLPTVAIRRVLRDVQPSVNLHPDGTRPLREYFRDVRIVGDTAIVAFDAGAMAYLNNAACAQIATKTPIVRTLVGLVGSKDVVWEIDGEIVVDWDA